MFDAKLYWKRRKDGLRGQTQTVPEPHLALWTKKDFEAGKCSEDQIGRGRISGVQMRPSKRGLQAFTRKMYRQKFHNRHYTVNKFKLIGQDKITVKTNKNGSIEKILGKKKYEQVEDKTGTRLTKSGVQHRRNIAKKPPVKLPTKDPKKVNHQRMLERKIARKTV